MNLKRLWDTENKKTVRAIPTWDPHKKFQVWTDDDGSHLYVYANSKYEELNTANASVSEYWPTVWKTLDDETVGYYLTNEPTDLYNWDEWDEVTYTFKDYDGTVLKTGKVDEGTAPTPPADPTRAATAQYTYTFAGWNPTVWPITKKTTYTATYTATVNKYTITATSSDADLWTVSPASVANVEYGTALTVADNVITVGTWESAPTITATAGEWNTFTGWLDWTTGLPDIPSTVTGNITVEAEFEAPAPVMRTVTFSVSNAVWDENEWDEGGYVPAESQDPLWWTVSPQSVQVPDWWTFTTSDDGLAFFSPDGNYDDEDAINVTITPDLTISADMSWDYGNWVAAWEISWTELDAGTNEVKIIWDVSSFPLVFYDDA